ncbi:unnamed protein product [Discosporangium mesarthrocarpum]
MESWMKLVMRAVVVVAAATVGHAFNLRSSSSLAPFRRQGLKLGRGARKLPTREAYTTWQSSSRSIAGNCGPITATERSTDPMMHEVPVGRREGCSSGAGEESGGVVDGLNESQRQAVTASLGPIRVVAGPGSGKTRVLTRRIAHLVRNLGAPPWSLLAVTFTNKAAAEMRGRVTSILGQDVTAQVTLGTFHSVCALLMRRFGDHLPSLVPGLDGQFTIFDADDSRRLTGEILKELGLDVTKVKPNLFCSAMSWMKSQGKGPNDVMAQNEAGGGRWGSGMGGIDSKSSLKTLAQVFPTYQKRLAESNAVDFDDLILLTLRLLREDKQVYQAVGRKYRHILVDEWQDTNGPQYDLVRELTRAGQRGQQLRVAARGDALAAARAQEAATGATGVAAGEQRGPGPGGGLGGDDGEGEGWGAAKEAAVPESIFVVGDTDQSIYAFRGAVAGNVEQFERDFKGCQSVLLCENYRSTSNIAGVADAVIKKVQGRKAKPIKAVQGSGFPVAVVTCADAQGEAAMVADQAGKYLSCGRVPASEVAVMYRTNAQSRSFEESFLQRGLPFVVVGAQRFYERREVGLG